MTVGLLVVTLIIGILVVQNMRSETADGTKKSEAVERARQTKDQAEAAAEKLKRKIEGLEK
jgi:uncharacterized membrane protein